MMRVQGGGTQKNVQTLLINLLSMTLALSAGAAAQKMTVAKPAPKYGSVPLHFEKNVGQTDARVRFLSRGNGYTMFLTDNSTVLSLIRKSAVRKIASVAPVRSKERQSLAIDRAVVSLAFEKSTPTAAVLGEKELEGKANYLTGKDPKKWHTDIPLYSQIRYSRLYEGVDAMFYGAAGHVEYDLVLSPHADPTVIRMKVEGANSIKLEDSGDVRLLTNAGPVVLTKPTLYQASGGQKRRVDGRYVLKSNNEIGIVVPKYDNRRPLVIDPALEYSTYLGGSGQEGEYGDTVGVDPQGNVYIEGITTSTDFPFSSPATIGTIKGNGSDVLFVSKINPSGTALVYTTYIGGTGNNVPYYNGPDEPGGVAVDANGYAYITGVTAATDFPVTSSGFQTALTAGALYNAFLAKLSANGGSLMYSTYLGGNNENWGQAVSVDSHQTAYLTGWTTATSPGFPLTAGAYQTTVRSTDGNVFATKIDTTQSGSASLVYSTLIGGSSTSFLGDMGNAITYDASGKIYITGETTSTDFPITSTAYQSTGGEPPYGTAFMSEFDPTQSGSSALVYSSFLGGDGVGDFGYAIAVDQSGKVHVGGHADPYGFPTTIPDSGAAFVAEFDTTKANGASLVYSRCFGGASEFGAVFGIAVDSSGNTYAGGYTQSTSFPLTPDAVQVASPNGAPIVGFFSIFSSDASTMLYSSYFGSSNESYVSGVGLDSASNIYITGLAQGIELPTTQGAFQSTLDGGSDLFVARFGGITNPTITGLSVPSGTAGTPVTISGLNFGSSQGTVTFNGVTAVPTTWNATSIVVPVPAGATSGSIVVTSGGIASNGVSFTVLQGNLPIVLVQHSRKSAGTTTSAPLAFASANTAGNWIGVCIRASGTNQPLSVTDSNGNLYQQALSVNETGGGNTLAIFYAENIASGLNTVTVSDTTSANLQFIILEYSGVATYGSLDTTTSAIGNSTSPATGTATTSGNVELLLGEIISATGTTFTAGTGYTEEDFVPATPSTQLMVEDQVVSQSGTVSATGSLAASGYWGAGLAVFKAINSVTGSGPTITSLSPLTGSNGTVVTISGYNFGATQGSSTVKFNTTTATPTSWGPNSITVADPAGATDGYIVVKVNGVSSNGVWFPQPHISTTSPTSGAVGTSVSITGTHFGTAKGIVRFNGVAVPTSQVTWTGTQITAPVPGGATTGPIVVVNSAGITSNEFTFSVSGTVPRVSGLSPNTGSVGQLVTINGNNFGSSQGSSTVTFNGVLASTAQSWSASQIKVHVPTGATTGNVVVTVGGQSDLQTNIFTVPGTASISNMTPVRGGVGTEVTITGSNFGTTGTITFNGVAASAWSWSSTLITVPVPAGATSGTVMVTAGGTQMSAGTFDVRSRIPSTATEFSYDAMGRVIQKTVCTPMNCGTEEPPLNLTATYDLAGDLTSVSFYGTTINYQIDAVGRVTQVTSNWVDSQHPATLATVDSTNGYWPDGELREVTLGNNLTESDVYNSRGQPCRINVNSSGALLSNCADALPSGNVQDLSTSYNAGTADNGNVYGFTGSGQQNFSRTYVYDNLNRIQTMAAPGDSCSGLSWTYDAWGNRLSQNPGGGSCLSPSVSVDTNNRLLGAPYQYDAAGDLQNDGFHSYSYDAEGRIVAVDNGTTAAYVYDAFGTRVEKNVGGVDSEYVYDQSGKLNTIFDNGSVQRQFVYLGGGPLAEYFENTTYFVHADHVGSTRLLTRLDQTVRESDDYYPFGELTTSPDTGDVKKFDGKEHDTESNLENFGARYDAAFLGRFMTPDWAARAVTVPYANFGDPQSLNLYGFVRNDPVSLADLDGHISPEAECPDPHGCNPLLSNTINHPDGKPEKVGQAQNNCRADTCVTVTAQAPKKSFWGRVGGWLGGAVFGIVRWGKLGGPLHRAGVERVARVLREDGYKVDTEVRIPTPNGSKSARWVDVVGTRNGEVRMYQIGKQNLDGTPVAREVRALDDIEGETGIRPNFVPYNIGDPSFGVPGATDMAPGEGIAPGEGEVPGDPEIIPE